MHLFLHVDIAQCFGSWEVSFFKMRQLTQFTHKNCMTQIYQNETTHTGMTPVAMLRKRYQSFFMVLLS